MQTEIRKRIFFVLTPPRARSAWLSNFLSWGPSMCHHEVVPEVDRIKNLHSYFGASAFHVVGTVDNGIALFAPRLLEEFPDAQYVCITRDAAETASALVDAGLEERMEFIEAVNAGIEFVKKNSSKVLEVNYHLISRNLENIWNHCVGPLPAQYTDDFSKRAMQLERFHIEIDMRRERARLDFCTPNLISLFTFDLDENSKVRPLVLEGMEEALKLGEKREIN